MDSMIKDMKENVVVITIRGRVQQNDSAELEKSLEEALNEGKHKIVVDLIGVQHICSTALGVLVSMKRRLRRNNGDIKIAVSEGDVKNLLQITMLDRVFDLHDSQDAAVQACN